jgi:very-short-patch-repair endonuclease
MRHRPRELGKAALAKARSSELRSSLSPPEATLWQHLRGSRLEGLKFRRQAPIGPYFADFLCPRAQLVIEIDGRWHDVLHDARRDEFLRERGFTVLRISAEDVRTRRGEVLAVISRTANERIESLERRTE